MSKPSEKGGICASAIFDKLFLELAPQLRNFMYYRTGNTATADDLVQEAFLRMWNNCAKVLPEKAKSYVFTVASNLFLKQKEKEKVVAKFEFYKRASQTTTARTPEEILEEQEFKEQLEAAIAQLPAGAREVFLLNRIEGLKYREIAEMLNISQKAVEKRMHRALLDLRKLHKSI